MKTQGTEKKTLVGNSFPFSLIRCERMVVEQKPLAELKEALADSRVVSFWGHQNTRAAAEMFVGVSLATGAERPALSLSPTGRPMLGADEFSECWLLSPDYPDGFRPPIGAEVSPEMIKGWHVLKLSWQKMRKEQ